MNNENRTKNPDGVWEISVDEVKANLGKFELIDVRREDEFYGELGHIQGARLSTLQTTFQDEVEGLSVNKVYVFVCRSGQRSSVAGAMAMEKGVIHAYNMVGGMLAWNEKKLPIETD
jgi:rhodanese-related sulfurtransferase